jgi:hypothetical protein
MHDLGKKNPDNFGCWDFCFIPKHQNLVFRHLYVKSLHSKPFKIPKLNNIR